LKASAQLGLIHEEVQMPLWQRLVLTIVAIVVASFIIGLIWYKLLGFGLPSYVGGVIGGLTAVPVWEFLKRIGPKKKQTP